jgi:hypothetical protein
VVYTCGENLCIFLGDKLKNRLVLRRRYFVNRHLFFIEPLSLWESEFGKDGGEGARVASILRK